MTFTKYPFARLRIFEMHNLIYSDTPRLGEQCHLNQLRPLLPRDLHQSPLFHSPPLQSLRHPIQHLHRRHVHPPRLSLPQRLPYQILVLNEVALRTLSSSSITSTARNHTIPQQKLVLADGPRNTLPLSPLLHTQTNALQSIDNKEKTTTHLPHINQHTRPQIALQGITLNHPLHDLVSQPHPTPPRRLHNLLHRLPHHALHHASPTC